MPWSICSAFYHDPPVWIEINPVDFKHDHVDREAFNKEVVRGRLVNDIEYRVSVEGVFSFNFSSWPPGRLVEHPPDSVPDFDKMADSCLWRTVAMNSYLTFFYSRAISECRISLDRMVATPSCEILTDHLDMTGTQTYGSNQHEHLAMSRYVSTYNPARAPIDDHRMHRKGPIPKHVVELATEDFSQAFTNGEDDLILLDLFLRGSKAYQDHNHSVSVISYWTVAEKLINSLWIDLLNNNATRDGHSFINRKRKDALRDPRTYSAAVRVEILSLSGVISLDLYEQLSVARKARNNWVHNLATVDRTHAEAARVACEELLSLTRGYKVSGISNLMAHG